MTIKYFITNNTPFIIDTFDSGRIKEKTYRINSEYYYTQATISTNGIETYELQHSTGNTIAPDVTTSIVGSNTVVSITNSTNLPITLDIDSSFISCVNYGENTPPGMLIRGESGFGLSSNNITIRSNTYNQITTANSYISANVTGPITTENELFNWDTIIVENGAVKNINSIDPSGQSNSCGTITLDTTPGELYLFSTNSYYTFSSILAYEDTVDIESYVSFDNVKAFSINKTPTLYHYVFEANSNQTTISLGFGSLGTSVHFQGITCKRYVPMHTYNQSKGTIYVSWSAVAASSNVISIGNNTVLVNSSNTIYVNGINCGAQSANNKLMFRYSNNTITGYALNNNYFSANSNYYANSTSLTIYTALHGFSYTPDVLDSDIIIGMTHG